MTKYTPEKTELFHITDDYLDKIVTEFFGKEYVGQQTGEMLPNDSFHLYYLTGEDEVEEELWEDEPKRTYLGYDRYQQKTLYHEGHTQLEYWLSLSHDTDNPDNRENPREGTDHYGESFYYDFQVYRQAPEPKYMLAYMIKEGVLPHGIYLMGVSW